jgi:hypothetical protein
VTYTAATPGSGERMTSAQRIARPPAGRYFR